MEAAELDLRAARLKLSGHLDCGLSAALAPRPFVEMVAGPQALAKIAFGMPSVTVRLLFDVAADVRISRAKPTYRPVFDLKELARTNHARQDLGLFAKVHDGALLRILSQHSIGGAGRLQEWREPDRLSAVAEQSA